jgi:hypothetical protein
LEKLNFYHGLPLTEKCRKCHKKISDREWVTCWEYCDVCLSASLEDYERQRRDNDRGETQ